MSPKAKNALMMPAKTATEMPRTSEKSDSPLSAFAAGVTSRSLLQPAQPFTYDSKEADKDAKQDHLTGALVQDGMDGSAVDWRDQRAEGRAQAERDRIPEGNPEIPHRESEGEASDAPERSPKDGKSRGNAGGQRARFRPSGAPAGTPATGERPARPRRPAQSNRSPTTIDGFDGTG